MTRGQKKEAQDERALSDAIRRIEETKRRKAGVAPLSDDELNALLQAAQAMEASAQQAPEQPLVAPKRKGRPPGSGAQKGAQKDTQQRASTPIPDDQPPASPVSQLTAHTPLGLIEVQESSDLDALLADKTLAPLIAMRLEGRFALVLPGSTEKLLAALRKAGHTPKVEDRA